MCSLDGRILVNFLGFTNREGFLDWLWPSQLLKTPFSCIQLVLLAILLVRLLSLLSCAFT